MTAVEIAESRSRKRALGFLALAALAVGLMLLVSNGIGGDFARGLWFGVMLGSAINLLPIKRLVRPNDQVLRLMDDEGTRENRRLSSTIGFWAAIAAALGLGLFSRYSDVVDAWLMGQLVATAAIVAAMLTFGALELRDAR